MHLNLLLRITDDTPAGSCKKAGAGSHREPDRAGTCAKNVGSWRYLKGPLFGLDRLQDKNYVARVMWSEKSVHARECCHQNKAKLNTTLTEQSLTP